MMITPDCLYANYSVVLCDGMFPEHELPLTLLDRADRIVCCDGAATKLLRYGKEPYAIVGDMDSLPDDLRTKYADRIFGDDDQETNDLTKAVVWCYQRNISPIIVLGATGLREDHTVANIALLADYIDFVEIAMVTDTGVFIPINRSRTFKCSKHQQVSIFAISTDTKISTSGLKYEVANRRFSNWNQGTLNETLAESFHIAINDGAKVIVYLRIEKRKFDAVN